MAGRRKVVSLIGACALAAGGLLALTSTQGGALTQITVTSSFDIGGGTLRGAFIAASAGGTAASDDVEIIIPASVGTITLMNGQLAYDGGNGGGHSLTLRGAGNTITQATANSRVINVTNGTQFTMDGLSITDGVAPAGQVGGGIWSSGSTSVVISNSTITRNSAPDSGGAIHMQGNLTITNSTISGNMAVNASGAIFTAGTATITGSTISGNLAPSAGGIEAAGLITLTNSTVSGNTGTFGGGGVLPDGPLALVYSTIAGNTSTIGAASIDWDNGPNTLTSFGSVVALPLGGGLNCQAQSATFSQGYNWEDANSCGFGAGLGDMPNAGNPLLGALTNNGGPTMTRAPQAGSGLIDKIPASSPCGGVNITVDQRGLPRPTTLGQFCDIGAVELPQAPQTTQTTQTTPVVRFTG